MAGEGDSAKTTELLYALAIYLQRNPAHATKFSVSHIPLPSQIANSYAIALQSNKNVEQLRLVDCGLTDDCVLAVCIGLQNNTTVTLLDLSSNKLTSNSVECVLECVDSGLPLASLVLAHNAIEEFPAEPSSKAWYPHFV